MTSQPMAPPTASACRWWILAGVSLSVLMATLDSSIVNIALRTLVAELHTSFVLVEWVVLSYLLIITSLILGVARLGDMWGKKRLYVGGLVVFTAGSLLCGLAPDVYWLIGFRVVQGLGAVMITALGSAIVTEAFAPHERGRAIGIIGSALSLGIAIGPSVGGVLLGYVGWRAIFLVNLPIGIVTTAIIAWAVPAIRPAQTQQRFDYVGALLTMVALTCYALGMTLGQERGFGSPLILGLLGVALVGTIAFVWVESRIAQPMLNLSMFRNGLFSMSLLIGVLVFILIGAPGFILPFFIQQVMGYSTVQTGLLMAIVPLLMAVISPISGSLSDRYGARAITLLGLAVIVVGCYLTATLPADVGLLGYLLRVMWVGIGFGMFQSPNNSAIMGSVPRERLGVASGLLALSRSLGQVTGIPLLGVLFAGAAVSAAATDISAASPAVVVAGTQMVFHAAALIGVATLVIAAAALWLERRQPASAAPVAGETPFIIGE